ncbi:hypothetical protein C7S18_09605 [Ahniella affigens]|uniref:Uncharacterized protein n=1 Tax=Ahniella affigens TaxID=2021234 RepID=A0A2P1PRH5_9GAMM|nr:hypothetical protein C7S18_09605 [Ahniella affigens]
MTGICRLLDAAHPVQPAGFSPVPKSLNCLGSYAEGWQSRLKSRHSRSPDKRGQLMIASWL